MTTTTLPTITHRIAYDATTRDYACYVQISGDPEQYIGSASSYHAGELRCVEYKRDLLESGVFTSATADPTPEGIAPYDNEELAHWWAKDQEVFALKLMALTPEQLVLQATTFTAHINDRAYKSILLPGIQVETTLRVWRSIIAKASPPIEPPPALAMRVAA